MLRPLNQEHRHPRFDGQQFRQSAFVMSIEMLYKNESHSCVRWQMGEQFRERLQAAGRSADAYDDQMLAGLGCIGWLGFGLSWDIHHVASGGERAQPFTARGPTLVNSVDCRSFARNHSRWTTTFMASGPLS
jgi:hypothetical protein